MIARRWWLALAAAASLVAAVSFYWSTARVDVVVAARDVEVPRALVAADLAVRPISADLVPEDAARRVEDVIGLVPRASLLRGQLVLTRAVSPRLSDFRSGLTLGPAERAVAIPVSPVSAVGGAVVPGVRVDVIAIPVLGRAPVGRMTELLARGVLILDVRGESGDPFLPRDAGAATFAQDRLASVVVAIPDSEALLFADRVATSTFVLALADLP